MLDGGELVDAVPMPAGNPRLRGVRRRSSPRLPARSRARRSAATIRSLRGRVPCASPSTERLSAGCRAQDTRNRSRCRAGRGASSRRRASRRMAEPRRAGGSLVMFFPFACERQPPAAQPPAERGTAVAPVESLTHDSDFSAFLQPQVEEALKRAALKKLFCDPRFNVMDGLDTYIGDYTQPDPIPRRNARASAWPRVKGARRGGGPGQWGRRRLRAGSAGGGARALPDSARRAQVDIARRGASRWPRRPTPGKGRDEPRRQDA